MTALSLTLAGRTFTLPDAMEATGYFVGGVFQQVQVAVAVPGGTSYPYTEVSVFGTATANATRQAAPAYDARDAQATFDFGNGVIGAVSLNVQVADIDPTAASQTVYLTGNNFNLNLAGRNFTASDCFSAPAVTFEYGVLTDVSFQISSMPAGFIYSSLTVADGTATATLAGTTDTDEVPVNLQPKPSIGFAAGSPGPQTDPGTGRRIPGAVSVQAKFINAPLGGGNQVTVAYYEYPVGGGAPVFKQSTTVSPLGAADTVNSSYNGTSGKKMQVVVTLKNAAGVAIAPSVTADYTLP